MRAVVFNMDMLVRACVCVCVRLRKYAKDSLTLFSRKFISVLHLLTRSYRSEIGGGTNKCYYNK